MSDLVSPIANRLSLRPPQRASLEILAQACDLLQLQKDTDKAQELAAIQGAFAHVKDFERDFPSLCFALATGVGKTRLMGAFIAYLYRAQSVRNFFILAPNLTIYNKLIADFDDPSHPKYVFRGIAEFATERPCVITGENYEAFAGGLQDRPEVCKINIFNISKINSEVRGGKAPRIKRMAEYLGDSYFDYLSKLDDLVLLMDESHRYRASAGVRAINELRPILGLEVTATPFVESNRGPVPFKNVVLDYPLGKAIVDGFVKEPAVVTRKDFSTAGMSPEEVEQLKLEDGVRLHESVKVELETYARETGNRIVKPFMLVIARDTTHAGQLLDLIKSEKFFEGRYKDKVIQVDSSQTGEKEDAMIQRLLAVESPEEPTEIVIHVNMLKEGWDVTNLYTIVPLRAANARTLIEQSIGRGLRLSYGKRTGVAVVDRLNIVAHDKFQEIVDEANDPKSPIRLQQVVLSAEQLAEKTQVIVAPSNLAVALGAAPSPATEAAGPAIAAAVQPLFATPEEQQVARLVYAAVAKLETQPGMAPSLEALKGDAAQKWMVQEVAAQYQIVPGRQYGLTGVAPEVDIAAVVAKTAQAVVAQSIGIPRIQVVPKGEVRTGYYPFELVLNMNYEVPSEELLIRALRTGETESRMMGFGGIEEGRPEDYIVAALVDFDDICYDDHADLLYDLAGKVVAHFRRTHSEDDTVKILRCHQKQIAHNLHAQMAAHHWEEASGYETKVSRGFTKLKDGVYTAAAGVALDFRNTLADNQGIAKHVFTGFSRCLYQFQKFQSNTERRMALILDRDAQKWFKPAKGQFQIFYRENGGHQEYQPDFVAEADDCIYMIETKARNEMDDRIVRIKREVAENWCRLASDHAKETGAKPWRYLLIPHDAVAENMTLAGLAKQSFGVDGAAPTAGSPRNERSEGTWHLQPGARDSGPR